MEWSEHSAGLWHLPLFSRFCMRYGKSQGRPGVYAASFSWTVHRRRVAQRSLDMPRWMR
jgi:hypothetical protein